MDVTEHTFLGLGLGCIVQWQVVKLSSTMFETLGLIPSKKILKNKGPVTNILFPDS
jgi:hypothetical protein